MSLLRKTFIAAVALGCILAGTVFLVGRLVHLDPAFDLYNNFLPFLGLFCLALLVLSLTLRSRVLIGASVVLTAAVFAPILLSFPSAARQAPEGAPSFLRVATLNLWIRNVTHAADIARFLEERNADVVLLQEVSSRHAPLLKTLEGRYPHGADAHGLRILSKHPIVKTGNIGRPGRAGALICWARVVVNGKLVEVGNVHVAWPFDPDQQERGMTVLKAYVQSRKHPLIVGGDFNMTPWTHRLGDFTKATALQRFNTIIPTWPARLRGVPVFSLFPIDNVFASSHFAKVDMARGPWLGSDHRPMIADIAWTDQHASAR